MDGQHADANLPTKQNLWKQLEKLREENKDNLNVEKIFGSYINGNSKYDITQYNKIFELTKDEIIIDKGLIEYIIKNKNFDNCELKYIGFINCHENIKAVFDTIKNRKPNSEIKSLISA